MKVYIGPYRRWFGIYQLCDKVLFWLPKKYYTDEGQQIDKRHDFCSKYIADTWFGTAWNWCAELWLKTRINYVKIDKFDAWNACDLMAPIIHRILLEVKSDKHGAPGVDDEDVPENLRAPVTEVEKSEDDDLDDNYFKRWEYVLDEMIFAFYAISHEDEFTFRTGNSDMMSVPAEEYGTYADGSPKMFKLVHGPNDTLVWDDVGREAHEKRVQNGLRLFGKYYRNLWT